MSEPLRSSFNVAHQSIVDSISEISLRVRSYSQAKPKLREFKERLLAHLGRQDEEFYLKLQRFHRGSREATKMLEFLEKDLRDIKVQYLIFFEKHSGEFGYPSASNFSRDFTDFSSQVMTRVKAEDEHLLPLFESIPDSEKF